MKTSIFSLDRLVAGLGPLAGLFILLSAAPGCPEKNDCTVPGTEGCDCTSGGACDPGLQCIDNLCVSDSGGGGGGGESVAGGTAYVRLCHNIIGADKMPARVGVKVASRSLEAVGSQCAPAVGASCAAVPAGRLPIETRLGDQVSRSTVTLEPNRAYLLWTYDSSFEGIRDLFTDPYELESVADCSGLDFHEADLRLDDLVHLEPFRADGFSFARPRGLTRKTGSNDRTYRFEAADAQAPLNRFELTYLGRVPSTQIPSLSNVLARALSERKLTLVGKIETGEGYAAAYADTGKPGPDRYLRLMYITHYELLAELLGSVANVAGNRASAVDLFTAEMAFSSLTWANHLALPYVLKSIAWGISIPAAELPVAQLSGTWQSKRLDPPQNVYGAYNVFLGGVSSMSQLDLKFTGGAGYELDTLYLKTCANSATVPDFCVGENAGAFTTHSRGRLVYEAGVLLLSPWRCEARVFSETNVPGPVGACPLDALPAALRLEPGPNGQLLLAGLGLAPVGANQQQIRFPIRQDGPAGSWNRPWSNPLTDGDPASGRPATDSFNACGLQEAEPNDTGETATVYKLTTELIACAPTTRDVDTYDVISPAGADRPGYFMASLIDVGPGTITASVELEGDNKPLIIYPTTVRDPHANTTVRGAPLHFYWAAAPGKKYRVRVQSTENTPFAYTFRAQHSPAEIDPAEPNDTFAQARPLPLGTPVTGYFFAAPKRFVAFDTVVMDSYVMEDEDWFAVDLAAGNMTVRLEEVPANVAGEISVKNGEGLPPVLGDFSASGMPGQAFMKTTAIRTAGTYRIKLRPKFFPATAGVTTMELTVPANYLKPYRLVVTQP